jgi:hypothetical protein
MYTSHASIGTIINQFVFPFIYYFCIAALLGFGGAGAFDPHRNIQEQAGARPIWSVEYYAKFFDVDTAQVNLMSRYELDDHPGYHLFYSAYKKK